VVTEWQVRGCLGREWEWHVGPDKPWDAPGWLPARVPGSVLDDLARAREVPDPYHERNSLLAEWVPERAWVYRARAEGECVLEFEGVDHEATVFVDGVEAAHHEGAFTPFRVAIPAGPHLLAVVVHEAPESEPQIGRTSKVRVHKPRMNYGWDFCPRMIHQGIWRPVRVVDRAAPHVMVRLENGVGIVEAGGEEMRVESPELWWPNGMGAQHLYTVTAGGREVTVGFRTVKLLDDYALLVNGERVEIRGWNWVPIDALYGVPRPDKLAHLLGLAARANVNLLRVWGGGLIETDEFYDQCDRLGLLVWQEFSQSSSGMESVPSADPAFVSTMARDAGEIVPRLRHHASLAIWGGGNELDADDSTPVVGALRDVVHELDPGRAWLPTSPRGRDEHGPWEHQGLRKHYSDYDARTCLLHSEFGVEGMTNRRALEALVDEEHRWPADRSNPVYEHLGAWWNNAPLVQEAFGGRIADVETMRRASQWLQYEGLRYAVEANRRRGAGTIPWQLNESYPNAWCTSAVDHGGDPKPAYWGVARAYSGAPSAQFATCAWGGEREARAVVSAPARFVDLDGTVVAESAGGEIEVPLDAFSSDVFLLDLGANRYVMTRTENLAPLLDLPAADVAVTPSHRLLRGAGGVLRLKNVGDVAAIGIVIEDTGPYDVPDWIVLSDNVIDLLPGEERTIEVEGRDLRVEGWNVRA
jgi:beta-mannosidase